MKFHFSQHLVSEKGPKCQGSMKFPNADDFQLPLLIEGYKVQQALQSKDKWKPVKEWEGNLKVL